MATETRITSSVGQGISGIKETMKKIQETIKSKNEKASRMEKEVEEFKQRYIRAYGKQQGMRDRVVTIEEKLEKNELKIKDVQKRLVDKEKFLEESKLFYQSLKNVSADEALVSEVEERVKTHKDIYQKNYENYQTARKKKIQLEHEVEIAEIKTHETVRRMEALKTELEYNTIEEARRTQGCKDAIDAAFRAEKTCIELQRGLDVIMKRKDTATKQINKLEKEVKTKEDAIDTLRFERKKNEATIKEMLIHLKSQQAQLS